MKRMVFFFIALMGVVAFSLPAMAAEKPIVIGFPMWLSGGGGLFGQPSAKGAEMLVKEVNDAGGVLGRKIELLVRDCKGTPEEATRVSKELILKDNVDFLVGGLSASQGLAISEVAKQEKILYIAPISKAAEMCEPPRLHPYVFRAAANTNTEGRSAAVFMAKNPWKRIATIGPDYAYGQGVTKAFVDWIKRSSRRQRLFIRRGLNSARRIIHRLSAPCWRLSRMPLSFRCGVGTSLLLPNRPRITAFLKR